MTKTNDEPAWGNWTREQLIGQVRRLREEVWYLRAMQCSGKQPAPTSKTVDWALIWADAMHCDQRESQEALEVLAAEVRRLRAPSEPSPALETKFGVGCLGNTYEEVSVKSGAVPVELDGKYPGVCVICEQYADDLNSHVCNAQNRESAHE